MAADEARAQRFRDTYEARKAENPGNTWKALADHVDVSERAAQAWAKTGGVSYERAKKAADFWQVDFDWLWRGPKEDEQTPDPFAGAARESQVSDGFDEFRQYVADIRADIAAANESAHRERESIQQLLRAQQAILKDMQRVAASFPATDALNDWADAVQTVLARAEAAEAARAASATEQAGTPRRAAGNG